MSAGRRAAAGAQSDHREGFAVARRPLRALPTSRHPLSFARESKQITEWLPLLLHDSLGNVPPVWLSLPRTRRRHPRALPRGQRLARTEQGTPRWLGPRLVREQRAAGRPEPHSRPRRPRFRAAVPIVRRRRCSPTCARPAWALGRGQHASLPARALAFAHNGTLPEWEERLNRGGAHRSLAAARAARRDRQRALLFALPPRLRRGATWTAPRRSSSRRWRKRRRCCARFRAAGDEGQHQLPATDGRNCSPAGRGGRSSSPRRPGPEGRCASMAVASENPGEPPPGGRHAWRPLPDDALVAVDADLRLEVTSLFSQ